VELAEAMDRSLAGGNADSLAREAHMLRGMSANLAAENVATIATELEELAQAGALDAAAVHLLRLHAAVAMACDEMPRVLAELNATLDDAPDRDLGGNVSCK
jgi:HPt (histidine-containing phosphotransfer) domain-containing protein